MRRDLRTGLIAIVAATVVLGLLYPLAITGIAQVAFPGRANGSRLSLHGRVVGSSLIAQSFSHSLVGKNGRPELDSEGEEILVPDRAYFQPRPSATGYSGDATFFANVGPNSVAGREEVREDAAAYIALEKPFDRTLTRGQIPVDAVTQSASGVDPEISVANARIQAHRVAAVRRLPLARVEALISAHTHGRSLGLLGEPGVNVLGLNIALDQEAPVSAERGQRPYLALRNRAKREPGVAG